MEATSRFIAIPWCCLMLGRVAWAGGVPYCVPETPWPEQLGLHRAVVQVAEPADAVVVNFSWRRHDNPANKRLIVVGPSGKPLPNVFRVSLSSEEATLVIGPARIAGTCYIYYLPFRVQDGAGSYQGDYLPPEPPPGKRQWFEFALSGQRSREGKQT